MRLKFLVIACFCPANRNRYSSGVLRFNNISLLIPDIAAFAGAQPKSVALRGWVRSYLGIPLVARGELAGTLELASSKPQHFSDHDRELVQLFGAQAAIAVENARLYTQTDSNLRLRLQALQALQRVTQELGSTVELDRVLRTVLEEAMRFASAGAGAIVIWQGAQPVVRVLEGYSEAEAASLREFLGRGALEAALESQEERPATLYVADMTAQAHWGEPPLAIGSWLAAPVYYAERLAATILLQSERIDAFPSATVEFAEGLAMQVAIALGNADRFQEQLQRSEIMHRRAEQIALLLEVSRTVRSDRPLEDVLGDMAYAVQVLSRSSRS